MLDRTPIQFKPGTFRQGSEAEMTGQWYETHLIRWIAGVMRPIDGWEKVAMVEPADPGTVFPGFASPVRKTHVWVAQDGIKRWGILCESHLYVMTQSGEVTNITPTDEMTGPGDDTVGGYGDEIYFGSAGGLDPVDGPPNPTPPDPPLTVGVPPIYSDPYGYGMPRGPKDTLKTRIIGPSYSLDNFGDKLLAMTSTDRRLLQWDPNDPETPANPVVADLPGVVPRGRMFVVTPERHVMIFEDDDKFNRFGWCGQEILTDWNFADVNSTAGSYDLEPATPFVAAVVTRYGVLAFTATETYLITYYGSPYVYAYNFIGNYNAPVAADAVAALANKTCWLSSDGFWSFDGVNVQPLQCPILDWVQQTKDPVRQYITPVAIPLGVQSEVWFFFPQKNETGEKENTAAAIYNFDEKWWAQAKLKRTAGNAGSSLSFPLMSDGKNLYFHEKGRFYADAPELPYAQTAAINVDAGARQCTLRQGLVDTRAPAGDVQFWIGARKARIADASNIQDIRLSLAVQRDRGRLDFRVTGRDAFIRIQSMRNGSEPWTFGQFLCKKIPRGRR